MVRHSRGIVLILAILVSFGSLSFAAATASMTLTGTPQYSSAAGVWDSGTVTATVNGHSETVAYGQYSSAASIASGLAARFSMDCSGPVNAKAVGAVITFKARHAGVITSIELVSNSNYPSIFPPGGMSFAATAISPFISSLTLAEGPPQVGFFIYGANFGNVQGTSTVKIGNTPLTVIADSVTGLPMWKDSFIMVQVPTGAANGDVVVTVGQQQSNGKSFTVKAPFGCTAP